VTLHPPSQTQAVAAWERFCIWRQSWDGENLAGLEKATKRWTGLGVQHVPSHLLFSSPAQVAAFLGQGYVTQWDAAVRRWEALTSAVPATEALHKIVPWLATATPQDADRALSVARWLHANPQSGLYVRQIPVSGVDTKWVERNRAVVSHLLLALGVAPAAGLEAMTGLREDRPKCRFRLLDPSLRSLFAGLGDISTPIEDLSRLPIPADVVLVLENLQTALACPDVPGAMVFFGAGFHATELAALDWLADLPIIYWGDLDAAGFEILSALRGKFPHLSSFGMDEETLLAHRELWVADPNARGITLEHLTPDEQSTYSALTDGRLAPHAIRLEQERVDWASSWAALEQQLKQAPSTSSDLPHAPAIST
jgi:hypothetical protein